MTDTEAWIALLASYVLAYRRPLDQQASRALAAHAETLVNVAKPVLVLLDGRRSHQNNVINLIGSGKAGKNGLPTAAYASALLALRNQTKVGKNEDGKSRSDIFKKYTTSNSLTPEQRKTVDLLMTMLVPEPHNIGVKDAQFDKLLVHIKDPTLRQLIVPADLTPQHTHLAEIKHLVKTWTKRADTELTADEKKEIKESDPERMKRYTALQRMARESWEQFVRGMVRDNGGHPVKVIDAVRALDAEGIKHHPPLDFNGAARFRIGENGNLYTMNGTELAMKPAPNLTIEWNKLWKPQTDNTYVLKMRSPFHEEGRSTAIRSVKLAGKNRESNFQDALDAIPKVPTARKIWLRDLHGGDRTRRVQAAMAEIQYMYATRIGTVGNSTVALSTLRRNHAYQTQGGGIILSYIGKDSKPQRHVIKPENADKIAVINVIKRLMQNKKANDYLWTDANGKHLGPQRANEYIRKRCHFPLTGEKFRIIRGTELMQLKLANARIAKDAKLPDVEKKVKELAISVGELLGHVRTDKEGNLTTTATTAIKNYIVPSVIHKFFAERNLQTPKWVPAEGRGDGSGD